MPAPLEVAGDPVLGPVIIGHPFRTDGGADVAEAALGAAGTRLGAVRPPGRAAQGLSGHGRVTTLHAIESN